MRAASSGSSEARSKARVEEVFALSRSVRSGGGTARDDDSGATHDRRRRHGSDFVEIVLRKLTDAALGGRRCTLDDEHARGSLRGDDASLTLRRVSRMMLRSADRNERKRQQD